MGLEQLSARTVQVTLYSHRPRSHRGRWSSSSGDAWNLTPGSKPSREWVPFSSVTTFHSKLARPSTVMYARNRALSLGNCTCISLKLINGSPPTQAASYLMPWACQLLSSLPPHCLQISLCNMLPCCLPHSLLFPVVLIIDLHHPKSTCSY